MKFSLVLPTRERLSLFEGLLNSIQNTTSNLDDIEVWVAVDWDDKNTLSAIRRLSKQFSFVQFLVTDRQNNLSVGYYNRLAAISTGSFVQVLNDDCIFLTPSWDVHSFEVLEIYQRQFIDGVVYGKTVDNGKCGYSCFPILSRQAIDMLGWFFHPEITGWGADTQLDLLFRNVGRMIDVPLSIEHFSHHNGTRPRDGVSIRMGQISRYNLESAYGEAKKLRDAIKAKNDSMVRSVLL